MTKTFEPKKTISELWIDTSRKFIVVEEHHSSDALKWDILKLQTDDNSTNPYFHNLTQGGQNCPYLFQLAYYEENDNASDHCEETDNTLNTNSNSNSMKNFEQIKTENFLNKNEKNISKTIETIEAMLDELTTASVTIQDRADKIISLRNKLNSALESNDIDTIKDVIDTTPQIHEFISNFQANKIKELAKKSKEKFDVTKFFNK